MGQPYLSIAAKDNLQTPSAVFFLRNLDNRGYGGYNIKLQHPI